MHLVSLNSALESGRTVQFSHGEGAWPTIWAGGYRGPRSSFICQIQNWHLWMRMIFRKRRLIKDLSDTNEVGQLTRLLFNSNKYTNNIDANTSKYTWNSKAHARKNTYVLQQIFNSPSMRAIQTCLKYYFKNLLCANNTLLNMSLMYSL